MISATTGRGGGPALLVIIVEAGALLLAPALGGAERVADILDPVGIAVPADVDAGEVGHLERPHRHAELDMDLVDLLGRRAFEQQLGRLDLARHQHAVADEAVADAGDDRDLLDLLGELHRGDQHVGRGLRAAHHLEQLHHVGRREEVQAEHVLRPRGRGRDLVDVEIGGVGGEDRARLGDLVELAENLLLDLHILEHGLDDQVAIGEVLELERRLQQPHRAFDLLGGHPPLGRGRLVILAHHAGAAVERVLRHLDDRHRDAGAEEVHRDAAAHRAGADHADRA